MAEDSKKKAGDGEDAVEASEAKTGLRQRMKSAWKRLGVPGAVGAALLLGLGGAGVIYFGVGSHQEDDRAVPEVAHFVHPWSDAVKCSVPLWSESGNYVAKVEITFIYEARVKQEPHGDAHGDAHAGGDGHGKKSGSSHKAHGPVPCDTVVRALRRNWDKMEPRVVAILMESSQADFDPKRRKGRLEMRLVTELNRTLFPDNEAEVKEILWR